MRLPFRQIDITQYYGPTAFAQAHKEWYKNGLHLGLDFRCKEGTIIYSPIDGVTKTYTTVAGGLSMEIIDGNKKVFICHLQEKIVQGDKLVKAGQPIAYSGKSGKYTTGPHLHLSYLVNGAHQNPAPLFDALYTGEPIKNKDWEKTYCYHRYGKKPNLLEEVKIRFKNPWLHKQCQKKYGFPIPNGEVTNALVYGSWDWETVQDDSMYQVWSNLTKSEYVSKNN